VSSGPPRARSEVGELKLDGLELDDGLAELLALPGVPHPVLDEALGTHHLAPIPMRPSFKVSIAIL